MNIRMFTVAMIVLIIISCKKDDVKTNSESIYLKQISYVNGNSKIEQFNYSSGGLLTKHQLMFNGFAEQYESYFYSGNKLEHSEFYIYDFSNEKYVRQYNRRYQYDKKDRLSEYTEEEISTGKKQYAQIYYVNDKPDSMAFQIIDESYNTSLEGYFKFTTDVEGNIITSKKNLLDQPDMYPLISYRYDGKINPLKGLVNPMDFISFFAVANLVKDQSSTYNYQYNELNMPVSRNQRYGQAPSDTVTMAVDFIYGGL